MDPQILMQINEIYRNEVYAEETLSEAKEDEGLTALQKIRKRNKRDSESLVSRPGGQTDERRSYHKAGRGEKKEKGAKSAFGTMRHVGGPYNEELDLYDIVSEYLVSEGFCDSYEDADVIMANMSEEWRESIVEEVLQEDEAWRERNFRPMEPYKQEIVQGRHAELAGKTFSALDKLKKLDKKPLKRFRPGLKKRILSTAKSGKTAGRLATRAGESLIRQSHHDEKQKRNKISALKSIAGALEDNTPSNSIRKFTREELDLYDIISEYLVSEGFCDSYEDADVIMVNMSEEWVDGILDEVTGGGYIPQSGTSYSTNYRSSAQTRRDTHNYTPWSDRPGMEQSMKSAGIKSRTARGSREEIPSRDAGGSARSPHGSESGLAMTPAKRMETRAKSLESKGRTKQANKIRSILNRPTP